MSVYIASDLHVNHRNILQYCPDRRVGKDFPTDEDEVIAMVNSMNELIVRNWNSMIQQDDEVWILGDVCMGQMIHAPHWIRQLNGRKHLVKGNHDKTLVKLPEFNDMFASVQNYKELSFKHKDKKHMICMSHFPMASWNGMRDEASSIHFHGHLHSPKRLSNEKHMLGLVGRIMDVGLDGNDLFPYAIETAIEKAIVFGDNFKASNRHS